MQLRAGHDQLAAQRPGGVGGFQHLNALRAALPVRFDVIDVDDIDPLAFRRAEQQPGVAVPSDAASQRLPGFQPADAVAVDDAELVELAVFGSAGALVAHRNVDAPTDQQGPTDGGATQWLLPLHRAGGRVHRPQGGARFDQQQRHLPTDSRAGHRHRQRRPVQTDARHPQQPAIAAGKPVDHAPGHRIDHAGRAAAGAACLGSPGFSAQGGLTGQRRHHHQAGQARLGRRRDRRQRCLHEAHAGADLAAGVVQ
jgi:hypothetical protein